LGHNPQFVAIYFVIAFYAQANKEDKVIGGRFNFFRKGSVEVIVGFDMLP
jgi:hypothetical protein